MNKKICQLYFTVIMLALSAGIFLFCGFVRVLPQDVFVDGVAVGGMTYARAAEKVRAHTERTLKEKKLEIVAEDCVYTYRYPEIGYTDDLYRLLPSIRAGGEYDGGTAYYLCGKNEVIRGICEAQTIPVTQPYALFSGEGAPFTYGEGNDGRQPDAVKLQSDIDKALEGGFGRIELCYRRVPRTRTIAEVREETRLLSSFTTYYDGENANRASNIRLAAASLNGCALAGGKKLSFNDIVGDRTKERGYLPAKIIENGEFAEGVGGGVCQVSTTLYNAALLAGLKIAEYHPHSLAVGYVPPSRDAMVSGRAFDLKILNPSKTPVYIRAQTGENSLTVCVYGKSTGECYSIESVVSGSIVAPEEFTDDPAEAREGRDGLLSESYLVAKKGEEVRRVRLRYDKYLPVKRIMLRESLPAPEKQTIN